MVFGVVKDNLVGIRDFLGETTDTATGAVSTITRGVADMSKELSKGPSKMLKGDGVEGKAAEAHKKHVRIKMRNIFAAPLIGIGERTVETHDKTEQEMAFLRGALKDNFVFSRMSEMERTTLVKAMRKTTVESGATIIQQGDVGDFFYVIASGTVAFRVDGSDAGTADAGACFGELALMYDCPRAATCVATTACDLWRVDQHTFRIIRANHVIKGDKDAKEALLKVDFIKGLDSNLINHLASAMVLTLFKKGEVVQEKGKQSSDFYLFKDGKVRVTDVEVGGCKYSDITLGPGQHFGERMIIKNSPTVANVTAETDASAYVLNKEAFLKILGNLPLEEKIINGSRKLKLMAMPAFEGLENEEYDSLVSLMETNNYEKGHIFCEKGKPTSPKICFVRSGAVAITGEDGEEKLVTQGGYFGEEMMIWDKVEHKSSTIPALRNAIAKEDISVGELTLAAIESVVTDLSRLRKKGSKKELGKSLELPTVKKHRILGAGTFGQVWLVSRTNEPDPYALKIQYKRELIGYGQVDGVMREKQVMAELDHPFVLKLVETYQDTTCIYMLLQLVQGGEMYNIIHTDTRDGLSENVSKFYAANVLEGLSHMHRKNIIHRDLKFENILMDKDGFCVLIDFGFAKKVTHKTYTFCGTPLFIAPEVVLSEGHNKGADIWSYGIMIYEMVTGENPFYDDGMDQMSLFKAIVRGEFYFPDDIELSRDVKHLIRNLLATEPEYRLGCYGRGDLDIRKAHWFTGIDFRKILRKEYRAPWVPKIKDPFDASNFEDWSKLEKKEKSLEPLSVEEQDMFQDF
eukprot:CAMPEP_0185726530 /NCGR_PEP_ID=MMETSP1171-20130828/2491_1 /TAXON_ID=374046 /ORGANISM="Helicotheca tamensis, Strain CCMP826" /LENGTH=801 /DNA_ID=CAMNT_0028394909 /DNA_START=140 /DNA_END=2545 /DNA_ORIENTATION=+